MSRRLTLGTLPVAAMLAASCTLGPNYKRPVVETPPAYRGQQATAAAGSLADLAVVRAVP